MIESAFSSLRHSEDEVESVSPYVMIALGPTSALQMKLMKVFHGKIPTCDQIYLAKVSGKDAAKFSGADLPV